MQDGPWNREAFPHLPRARGAVDLVQVDETRFRVAGWLTHPRVPVNSIQILQNGRLLGRAPLIPRPDVRDVFPALPEILNSGFDVQGPAHQLNSPIRSLNLLGCNDDGPAIHLPWSVPDGDTPSRGVTVPDPALMQRVSGNTSAKSFATAGFQGAVDILSVLQRHQALRPQVKLLDWGCGSARITSQIARLLPGTAEIHGCDIDAEAIGWCRSALSGMEFEVCGIEPPLPYAPESFDVVVATSVMTHLDRRRQLAWLSEIRRVLKVEGLFLASAHGEFAAAFQPGMLARLTMSGIIDDLRDTALDGIAPPGYYRGVYQTQAYTSENWGRCLRVCEQIPAGLLGFQDLVVLQKSARLNCDQAV